MRFRFRKTPQINPGATPTPEEEAKYDRQVVMRRYKTAKTIQLAEDAERQYRASRTPAYRALMLKNIRKYSAIAAVSAIMVLGGFSAIGVHEAAVPDAPRWSIEWILGWGLEFGLLGMVGFINVVRAALAIAGARLSNWSWVAEFGLLGLSLVANVHALPPNPGVDEYIVRLTGPIGCLVVSSVLAWVEKAIQDADITIEQKMTSGPSGSGWTNVLGKLSEVSANAALRKIDTLSAELSADSSDHEQEASEQSADGVREQVSANTADADDRSQAPANTSVQTTEPVSANTSVRTPALSADGVDSANTSPADTHASADTTAARNGKQTADVTATSGGSSQTRTNSRSRTARPAPANTSPSAGTEASASVSANTSRSQTASANTSQQTTKAVSANTSQAADTDVSAAEQTDELPTIGWTNAEKGQWVEDYVKDHMSPSEVEALGVRPLARKLAVVTPWGGCSNALANRVRDAILEEAAAAAS